MSNLIERLRGYPGASLEVLMEGVYGKSYAGLAKEAADEIERLERAVDQEKLVHLDFIGELQEKIERLEGALRKIYELVEAGDREGIFETALEALDKEQT